MLRRTGVIFILAIAGLLIPQFYAGAARGPKFKHADRNKDGTVDKKEWRMEKKWENQRQVRSWTRNRARVNTSLEAKYDSDGDGWLEPEESKELLKDRYTLIKTKGKAKVDSPLEEEYDEDGDGIIDLDEAQALKEDLE